MTKKPKKNGIGPGLYRFGTENKTLVITKVGSLKEDTVDWSASQSEKAQKCLSENELDLAAE